jgi:hypothetical protein
VAFWTATIWAGTLWSGRVPPRSLIAVNIKVTVSRVVAYEMGSIRFLRNLRSFLPDITSEKAVDNLMFLFTCLDSVCKKQFLFCICCKT